VAKRLSGCHWDVGRSEGVMDAEEVSGEFMKKAELSVAMRIDRHADSTSLVVKFLGTVTMLFLNMSKHVSMMTHTYHRVVIHCTTQYLHNQYES